jgi:hypothetical protein
VGEKENVYFYDRVKHRTFLTQLVSLASKRRSTGFKAAQHWLQSGAALLASKRRSTAAVATLLHDVRSSAVLPLSLREWTSALKYNSCATTCACPQAAARCSAVQLNQFREFTSAPARIKVLTAGLQPFSAAADNANARELALAPNETSSATVATCP